ncbi:MAG: hypothetical protein JNL47_06700 [Bacteroidia bacterium]|nr:hypothetical protein [Bacteroidia bacterium]
MIRYSGSFCFCLLMFVLSSKAQLPFEVFTGHRRTTADLMFFKYIKHKEGSSPFLFFNRNRASVDYRQTSVQYMPQFGFTEALSYNHKSLKGFAPVVLIQILNNGTFPKAGIQKAATKKDFLFFSWLVTNLRKNPGIDWFLLMRFTPKITEKTKIFLQAETIHTYPDLKFKTPNSTLRARAGLQWQRFQTGAGCDQILSGKSVSHRNNTGIFVRYNFNGN